MRIPLGKPSIGNEEIAAATEVIKSGWVAHGPKNHELEELLADYFGVKEAVVVNSGASALQLALMSLNITGEVIVPSFTMSASANAIVLAGATPVFCDVETSTGNIDPKSFEEKITEHTQGVMPVHFAGSTCRMHEIVSIAKKYNIAVIEDAAETLGGSINGIFAGTFGDAGCFSFWASKNITTGEGGALITDNKELAQNARTIAAHGIASTTLDREKSKKPWKRDAIVAGYNMRMSNINAAIGVEQFKKIGILNGLRKQKGLLFRELLASIPGVTLLDIPNDMEHVFQMFVIKVHPKKRDNLVFYLREHEIGASVHFDPPVHAQTFYAKKYGSVDLPVTESLSRSVLTLPFYPDISKQDLSYIAETLQAGINKV